MSAGSVCVHNQSSMFKSSGGATPPTFHEPTNILLEIASINDHKIEERQKERKSINMRRDEVLLVFSLIISDVFPGTDSRGLN